MGDAALPTRAAANVAFIYLDGMGCADCITVWPHHSGAQFVKHCERRFIGGNPKLALKLDGRLPGCLCRHKIGAPKPSRERHMARLHDRSGSERRIFLTPTAAQYDRRARRKTVWLTNEPALRAREAARPADSLQITGASTVIREDTLKLGEARWEGCIHG
jgi:hypothetical protein